MFNRKKNIRMENTRKAIKEFGLPPTAQPSLVAYLYSFGGIFPNDLWKFSNGYVYSYHSVFTRSCLLTAHVPAKRPRVIDFFLFLSCHDDRHLPSCHFRALPYLTLFRLNSQYAFMSAVASKQRHAYTQKPSLVTVHLFRKQ